MVTPNDTSDKPKHPENLAFNLTSLFILVVLFAIGIAYGLDALVQGDQFTQKNSDESYTVTNKVAGLTLTAPNAWLTFPQQHIEGFVDRLDLTLPLTLQNTSAPKHINAVFLPRTRIRPSAQLLDSVYLHRFNAQQLAGPIGLVGKKMLESDGFQGETVWYDPLSANPFVAKCSKPVIDTSPGRCLRTLILSSGLALQLTFDEDLLAHWREMDAALAAPLLKIGAGSMN